MNNRCYVSCETFRRCLWQWIGMNNLTRISRKVRKTFLEIVPALVVCKNRVFLLNTQKAQQKCCCVSCGICVVRIGLAACSRILGMLWADQDELRHVQMSKLRRHAWAWWSVVDRLIVYQCGVHRLSMVDLTGVVSRAVMTKVTNDNGGESFSVSNWN